MRIPSPSTSSRQPSSAAGQSRIATESFQATMATATKSASIGINALHATPKTAIANIAKTPTPSRGKNEQLARIDSNGETTTKDAVAPVKARETSAKHSASQQREFDRKNDLSFGSSSKAVNVGVTQLSPPHSQQLPADLIVHSISPLPADGTRQGDRAPQPRFESAKGRG